jgi:hypothetical protein
MPATVSISAVIARPDDHGARIPAIIRVPAVTIPIDRIAAITRITAIARGIGVAAG